MRSRGQGREVFKNPHLAGHRGQPASVSPKDSAAPAFTIGAPTEAASPAAPKEDGEVPVTFWMLV